MGPQNGIMGNDAYGVELPQTQVDPGARTEMENAARFSKSKEYKALKEHLQSRISHYQTYLPDGRPAVTVNTKEAGDMWIIANAVIGEFKAVIDAYEQAAQIIKDEQSK